MKAFRMENQRTLFLVGLSLVFFCLITFENPDTDAQVRTVQSNPNEGYVTLSDFRKLLTAIQQDEAAIKNNSKLIQQLQQQVVKMENDSDAIAGGIKDIAEYCKKFDQKITFDLEPRVRQLEQAVKQIAQQIPRSKY